MSVILGPGSGAPTGHPSLGAVRKGRGRFETRIDEGAYKLARKGVHEEWPGSVIDYGKKKQMLTPLPAVPYGLEPDVRMGALGQGPEGYLGFFRGGEGGVTVEELIGKEVELNKDERAFLKDIKSFIIYEDRLGTVWVDYYADEGEAEKAWENVLFIADRETTRAGEERGFRPSGVREAEPATGVQYVLDRLVYEAASQEPPDEQVGDPFLDFGQWGVIKSGLAMRVSAAADRVGETLTPKELEILERSAGAIFRSAANWFAVWYIDDRKELDEAWNRVLKDWDEYVKATGYVGAEYVRRTGLDPHYEKADERGRPWPDISDRLPNPDDYAEPGSYAHQTVVEAIERLRKAFVDVYGRPSNEMRDYYDVPQVKEYLRRYPGAIDDYNQVLNLEKMIRGTYEAPVGFEELVLTREPKPEDFGIAPGIKRATEFRANVKRLRDAFEASFGAESGYSGYYEIPEVQEYLRKQPYAAFISKPANAKLVEVIKDAGAARS